MANSMSLGGTGLSKRYLLIVCGIAVLGLASCTPREDYRGYSFDNAKLAEIKPGVQTQDQVAALMGTPTTISTFAKANNTWYYVAKETESVAFFTPTVTSQRVVAIDFDNQGKVRDVRHYALKDGRNIDPLAQTTPSSGRELGFFEQLFGNVGRFNSNPRNPASSLPQ